MKILFKMRSFDTSECAERERFGFQELTLPLLQLNLGSKKSSKRKKGKIVTISDGKNWFAECLNLPKPVKIQFCHRFVKWARLWIGLVMHIRSMNPGIK